MAEAAPPRFEIGAQVKVPKFDIGTVQSIVGDEVTIEFPDRTRRTFMADFVEPA